MLRVLFEPGQGRSEGQALSSLLEMAFCSSGALLAQSSFPGRHTQLCKLALALACLRQEKAEKRQKCSLPQKAETYLNQS